MPYKWRCEQCEWGGDVPIQAHEEYEDGGYPACPNGCRSDGEPIGVILNPNHPDNMRKFAKAMREVR